MSIKIARINSEIVRTISQILLNETNDEIMKSITITAANTSKDLSFAKVYFTSLLNIPKEKLEAEMNEASPYIRRHVAEIMDMRNTPKLQFIYDESISYGNKIEKIIKDIHEKDA